MVAEMTLEQCLKDEPRLSLTDIDALKEWHKKQPHLPPMTDIQFAMFLHCCYFSLERAKICIDKFFTMRTHLPEVFGKRDVLAPENKRQGELIVTAELPKRDKNGYRVVVLGLQPTDDFTGFSSPRMAFLSFSMVEQLIREWPTCPGYTFVMDAQHLQMGHISRSPIALLHKLLTYVQEAAPLRMKIVHVVNVGPLVEKVMMLIRPFLGPELQKILHFHSGTMDGFYEEFPKDTLPKEIGGTSGSLIDYHNALLERLRERRDLLIEQEKQVVDESRRPDRERSAGDVFGVEGSFKKLDID